MNGASLFFLVFSALIALVGLAAAAASVEFGLSLFGTCLFLFGVLFAVSVVKRHFDAVDAGGAGRR
jgi:hypothetical protein